MLLTSLNGEQKLFMHHLHAKTKKNFKSLPYELILKFKHLKLNKFDIWLFYNQLPITIYSVFSSI